LRQSVGRGNFLRDGYSMSELSMDASGNDVEVPLTRSDRLHADRPAAASDRDLQSNEPRTIGSVIRAHAELRPEAPAFVGTDFAPLNYGELQRQIDDVRNCLRQAGFDRHARIAVGIVGSADAAWTIAAIACAAEAVPLDPKLTFAEVERCLLTTRPNAVIVLRGISSAALRVAEQHNIPIIDASPVQRGKLGLKLTAPHVGPACPLDEPDPDAPAFILHTSGTTIAPNLVPFSHRNVLASAERVRTWFGLTPQDRCLNVSPVYYSHALTTTVLPPLLTGGSAAFPTNPLNVDLAEWFGALRPTWYSAGPTLHLAVVEKTQLRPDARNEHHLRFISSAGAKIPKEVHDGVESALGVAVLEHYGSSETAQIASNMPPPGPCKPGTCGIPWPDTIKIVGPDGQQVPVGEQGEILVNRRDVMSGYLNAPELNQLAFIDGWYRTGDIGSLDADGFLSLHARKREMINRGAEKIAPIEIDHALMRHPEVAEAAAYGVPHARLGEDVAAAVVLRRGSKIQPAELREFLSEQLATFKIPRRITIVDRLPKGITGKVQRTRLNGILSREPPPPDPAPRAEPLGFWGKLKHFATLRIPGRSSAVDRVPEPTAGDARWTQSIISDKAAPSDADLHAELLQVWKRLLKVEKLSIDDDFFEKGGNSLLVMDLHMEIERLTAKPLPESFLSEASTIRAVAKARSS
jgi:acyl-CoA synthetase (AMP-forming)/AMP-acid ligase II/acyl carrier protein